VGKENSYKAITDQLNYTEIEREWIPPIGLQPDGSINTIQQELCINPDKSMTPYPLNCLSTVVVVAQEAYRATINIYDHLGKFIHSSTQQFGYCESEKENSERYTPIGSISWLVWNQRNLDNRLVGSGVFIWKVQFSYENGNSQLMMYKQGIARQDNPLQFCAQE